MIIKLICFADNISQTLVMKGYINKKTYNYVRVPIHALYDYVGEL